MSDPFQSGDPWGDFDDVDTEDFGAAPFVPRSISGFLPSDEELENFDFDWEQVITKHMADEIAREIDRAIIEHLPEATDLPTSPPTVDMYPHRCPRCGGRAYVGMASVDCEARCGA